MLPVRLSFVTYNLWGTEHWPQRETALRLFLDRYKPDVVCVQELTPETGSVLDDVLPIHEHVHDDFIGWTTEGNIWWSTDLFELVEYGAEEFDIEAYPNRRLFWVRLRVIERSTTIFVGDVHLSDSGQAAELEEGQNNRVREAKAIIGSLGRLVKQGEPAFLLGDFNDSLAPLGHLFMAGYESPWARLHQLPPPTMPAFPDRLLGYGFASNFVLDWIVANRNARPLSVSSPHVYADNVPPSDHWPIQAVYELIAGDGGS
jgi:endonuclease/exonuclease/phosphatase family metal-dependent hydrolase